MWNTNPTPTASQPCHCNGTFLQTAEEADKQFSYSLWLSQVTRHEQEQYDVVERKSQC